MNITNQLPESPPWSLRHEEVEEYDAHPPLRQALEGVTGVRFRHDVEAQVARQVQVVGDLARSIAKRANDLSKLAPVEPPEALVTMAGAARQMLADALTAAGVPTTSDLGDLWGLAAGHDVAALLDDADKCLYTAKADGRNCIRYRSV